MKRHHDAIEKRQKKHPHCTSDSCDTLYLLCVTNGGSVYARMEFGSGNEVSEVQRTTFKLLNQLDGFEASNKIKLRNWGLKRHQQEGAVSHDLEASLQVLHGLYEYLHALSEVNPHASEISMTCRLRIYNYDKVVTRIAQHLNLDDPSKIRLTSHNWCIKKPKREPIKYRCLKNAGLPQNEDNVVSMFCFLKLDTKEYISYGHVRNFMFLLPSNQLQEDPWWPCLCIVYIYKHSTDTIKTRVQASTISFPEMIAKLPEVS
ncbi:mitochondrial substrate carrier family protein C [Tanacetum coccineum]